MVIFQSEKKMKKMKNKKIVSQKKVRIKRDLEFR